MGSVKHDPADGAFRFPERWIPKASLVGAFLLGVAVWLVLRGGPSSNSAPPEEAARFSQRSDSAVQASRWVDATLTKLREDRAAEERENARAATMEEFLEENRKDSKKWERKRNEELDQIVMEARSMRGISDPAAALRTARADGTYEDGLVIFQYWLETDPDAALAEIGGNWRLLEMEYLPALLERKFGIDWMKAKVADEETPYRLRTALARELGWQAAHGQGLAGLLEYYNSIPDPRLKILMAWDFTQRWPIEEPKAVVRFLSGNVPEELRELLIQEWKRLPCGENSWEEVWVRSLLDELGLDASGYVVPSPGMAWGMDLEASRKLREARKSMTLDEVVKDRIREGSTPENAVRESIGSKLHDALADGRNLIEMFGEGRLTREELLDELRREIPGSEAHIDALEREVWRKTAWAADPEEVVRWAAELARRGDIDELLIQAFASSNIDEDPRIPLRLARYRTVTQGLTEGRPRDRILDRSVSEWMRWQAVSPVAAKNWLRKLPQYEPMYEAIRAEEALERRRKENQ